MVVGLLTGLAAFLIPLGMLLGVLVTVILFGRFAQTAQYRPSRGSRARPPPCWRTCAATGRSRRRSPPTGTWTWCTGPSAGPGVILVGEGSPNRLASLLAAEKKRVARVAYEVPIFEFQVGDDEGQIPISKLQRKIMRLPRNLKPDRGHRHQPPAQGAAADPADAQGTDAEERQAAQDAAAEGPLSEARSQPAPSLVGAGRRVWRQPTAAVQTGIFG